MFSDGDGLRVREVNSHRAAEGIGGRVCSRTNLLLILPGVNLRRQEVWKGYAEKGRFWNRTYLKAKGNLGVNCLLS